MISADAHRRSFIS